MSSSLISKGRLIPNKEFVGGLYKVWFSNFGLNLLINGNVITGMESGTTLYEYDLKSNSKLTQEVVSNRDNGTTIVNQTLTLELVGGDSSIANEIKMLALGRPQIFVQDNYGQTVLVGLINGADLTTGTHDTGAAQGDKYGYTLTFVATEREYAEYVSGSTIASAFGVVGTGNIPTIVLGT